MRVTVTTLLCGAMPLFAWAEPFGSLVFHPVDYFGSTISGVRFDECRNVQTGVNYAPQISGDRIERIRYGRYQIVARLQGFESFRRTVVLDRPQFHVTVALKVGDVEGVCAACTDVDGSVSTRRNRVSKMAVKLVGVFSEQVFTIPIDQGGRFAMLDLPGGSYILVVLSDQKVIKAEAVVVKGLRKTITLRL